IYYASHRSLRQSELRNEIWESHAKLVFGQLNEKHRRWVAGLLSEVIGWGGAKQIAEATGIDPKTIRQGRLDLQGELEVYLATRIRREGGGKPLLKKKRPQLNKS
ncbi:MAG: hypothetical protein SVR94_08010, partial [Pseudomonadota bacterium]|nr:hypothetical protein [Pseudomonadota bacterium]